MCMNTQDNNLKVLSQAKDGRPTMSNPSVKIMKYFEVVDVDKGTRKGWPFRIDFVPINCLWIYFARKARYFDKVILIDMLSWIYSHLRKNKILVYLFFQQKKTNLFLKRKSIVWYPWIDLFQVDEILLCWFVDFFWRDCSRSLWLKKKINRITELMGALKA